MMVKTETTDKGKTMTSIIKLALLTSTALIAAFNNNVAWKMDGDAIVIKDGNPVYLDSNGAEQTISVDALSRIRGEAQANRLA
jgi:hypothetical protein